MSEIGLAAASDVSLILQTGKSAPYLTSLNDAVRGSVEIMNGTGAGVRDRVTKAVQSLANIAIYILMIFPIDK